MNVGNESKFIVFANVIHQMDYKVKGLTSNIIWSNNEEEEKGKDKRKKRLVFIDFEHLSYQ